MQLCTRLEYHFVNKHVFAWSLSVLQKLLLRSVDSELENWKFFEMIYKFVLLLLTMAGAQGRHANVFNQKGN